MISAVKRWRRFPEGDQQIAPTRSRTAPGADGYRSRIVLADLACFPLTADQPKVDQNMPVTTSPAVLGPMCGKRCTRGVGEVALPLVTGG